MNNAMQLDISLSNKLLIGNFSTVRLSSVVVKSVGDNKEVPVNFAKDHKTNIRNYIRS